MASHAWQVAAVALVVLGATACVSRQSLHTLQQSLVSRPSVAYTQRATITEAIGGRKFTGYVSFAYGEDGRRVVTSSAGVFAHVCKKRMAEWNALGRTGRAPCATVTIELDGEPPDFYVATGWTPWPAAEKSLERIRTGGFVPGGGGAVTSQVSSLMSSMLWSMYGGVFQLVGSPTPESCEALRPGDTLTLIDGGCQPAILRIH